MADVAWAQEKLARIGERADREGLDSLNEHERRVLLPWFAIGVIGNGGLSYWFDGQQQLSEVVTPLRMLGFEAAANACERVLAEMFGVGGEPRVANRRHEVADSFDWSRVKDEEGVLLDVDRARLLEAIGAYMEAYRTQFRND